MILTLSMYFMGRDMTHAAELTDEIRANAAEWVRRNNLLYEAMARDGVGPAIDQVTRTPIASGWRPRAINDRTSNAALRSTHLIGRGGDHQDHRDRRLARWCLAHLKICEQIGLWIEDPRWTAGRTGEDPWLHTQTIAPRSGRRVFVPNDQPPQSGPLAPWVPTGGAP